MQRRFPSMILLSLVLCSLSSQASSRLYSADRDINQHNYQLISAGISNPHKVKLRSNKPLMARQEDAERLRKDMSPEQRLRLKERRKRFDSLAPEERQRLKETRKRFQQLPPEERQRLRQKWRNLSPEERDKAMQRKRRKSHRT